LVSLPALAWGEPTRAEYVAQLEPICSAEYKAASKANQGLTDDIEAGRTRSAIARVGRWKRIFERGEARIAAVPQPSADAAVLSQWLLARKSFVRALKPFARAITTGHVRAHDGAVSGRTAKRVALRALGADQLVEGFGFKSCLLVRVGGGSEGRGEGSPQRPTPVKPERNVSPR
jgi:hypothetical protein